MRVQDKQFVDMTFQTKTCCPADKCEAKEEEEEEEYERERKPLDRSSTTNQGKACDLTPQQLQAPGPGLRRWEDRSQKGSLRHALRSKRAELRGRECQSFGRESTNHDVNRGLGK